MAQQARPEDGDRVAAYYAAEGIRAEVRPFFDDVPQRLSEAQLVVARAGASTLADLAAIGRPAILIPLATAIADEQTAMARAALALGRPDAAERLADLAEEVAGMEKEAA